MKNKKNIDRLFQEKFKDFEDSPKEKVWKNIKKELQKREKRRVAAWPLWSKIAGVAAAIAILVLLGNNLFFENGTPSVVNSKEKNAVEKTDENAQHPFEKRKDPQKESLANSDNGSSAEKNGTAENTEKKSVRPKTESSPENQNQSSETRDALAVQANGSANNEVKNSGENAQLDDDKQSSKSKTAVQKSLAQSSTKKRKASTGSAKNQVMTPKAHVSEKTKQSDLARNTVIHSASDKKPAQAKHRDKPEKFNLKTQNPGIAKNKNTTKNQFPQKNGTSKNHEPPVVAQNEKGDTLNTNSKTEKRSLLDAIAEKEKDENEDNENDKAPTERFGLRPNVSPIYYSSLSGGSAIDPKFSDNKAKGEVTMAYGIDVSYALSKRIKIRSGISKVTMSYNTKDIAFTSSPQATNLKGLQKNVQTEHLAVNSLESSKPEPSTLREVGGTPIDPYTSGQLKQRLGFIEVPLEVEYALLDKRFAINVIGGASTLFLDDNSVEINSAQGTTSLGKASNLNSISFTTNLGLGFGYDLTPKLNFNLEPTFKYQLNGFSGDTGGFKPYYFGVYTGFSFKF